MNRRRFLAAAIGSLFAPAVPVALIPRPPIRFFRGEIGSYDGARFFRGVDQGIRDKSVVTVFERIATGPSTPFVLFMHSSDAWDVRHGELPPESVFDQMDRARYQVMKEGV